MAIVAACGVASAAALSGCGQLTPTYLKPLSPQTRTLLAEKGMSEQSPVLIRIFKAESELEVWKAKDDGRFYHFKTYPICSYSGGLGPKISRATGRRRRASISSPLDQMNPRSKYHLSFDVGFPNAYDRAYGRTGAEHHGAWRLHLGRLLRHDRCRGRGDLHPRARGAAGRTAVVPDPGLPVPHDGRQHGRA